MAVITTGWEKNKGDEYMVNYLHSYCSLRFLYQDLKESNLVEVGSHNKQSVSHVDQLI